MVSYYNPLSPAMFPNPPQMGGVARHQPNSATAAAAAAASHAYFHNAAHAHYAAAAYGHPVSNHYGQYAANLAADLNSNMYANGSGQNSAQFPSSNEGWTASAASAAASQWPSFGHNPPTTTGGSGGCGRFEAWPQNSDDSPPTPTNNENNTASASLGPSNNVQRPVSPGNYGTTQSHSSGSPSGTPTPGAQPPQPSFHQQDMQFTNKFNAPAFGGQPGPGGDPRGQLSPNAINVNVNNGQCAGSVLEHSGSSPILNKFEHVQDKFEHVHPSMASPVASSLASPTSGRPQPARSPYEWMKKPSYQCQPEKSGRTRTKDKYRVVYSDHQRLELEKEFHYSRYITIRRKAELANSVGLSERQVKIWFQNRRAKERRALKKHEEAIVKEKIDPTSAAHAAAAACAAAANFGFPFSAVDSFHPATSSIAGTHADHSAAVNSCTGAPLGGSTGGALTASGAIDFGGIPPHLQGPAAGPLHPPVSINSPTFSVTPMKFE